MRLQHENLANEHHEYGTILSALRIGSLLLLLLVIVDCLLKQTDLIALGLEDIMSIAREELQLFLAARQLCANLMKRELKGIS